MNPQPRIFCAAINFQKLDNTSDKVLLEASLENEEASIQAIKANLGFSINQAAVIKKCNAIIIVITYFPDYTQDFLKGRLLSTWDDLCPKGLDNSYRYIKCYENEDAIKFLCECALGVNSVTPGDTQVLAQVCDALSDAGKMQHSDFPTLDYITNWVKSTALEAKRDTKLYDGNTSLERIAAELIGKNAKKSDTVAVVGLGRTGSLVTKILSEELKLNVVITNRSHDKVKDIAKKYSVKPIAYDDINSTTDASYIVLAIPENTETIQYVSGLYEKLHENASVVDLSSPSITAKLKTPKKVTVYDVEHLTRAASGIIASRKSELDKVRAIIAKSVPSVAVLLSREYGKFAVEKAKKHVGAKLDSHTLEVLRVRDWATRSIREFYNSQEFVEVTTPYIVGVSSDPPSIPPQTAP
ncbi:MAG TPA: NAD(P)-binding domain-containing protein [Candidatus Limnocylindria bacterium]|nr:NAD(P)-binding domain-containing protein [Candidatus Limnocylindria bacterium]